MALVRKPNVYCHGSLIFRFSPGIEKNPVDKIQTV